ncbi:MAG: hypothetical protein M1118_02155 [Chloroflexi bacterium]|nr:hypothetical protein [Chloroflexota bacterium]
MLRHSRYPTIPLGIGLEEEFSTQVVIPIINDVIARTAPDLILAHEMFLVPVVAQHRRVPSILLTHWFFEPGNQIGTIMRLADQIIMLDLARFHETPSDLISRTEYIGPILGTSSVGAAFPSLPFGVTPGRYALIFVGGQVEVFRGLVEFVLQGLSLVRVRELADLQIVLLGQSMAAHFRNYARRLGISNLVALDFQDDVTALESGASFVVGRGSFTVMSELAALGTPSLQILDGHNPIDTFHARNFQMLGTARLAWQDGLSPAALSGILEDAFSWSISRKVEIAQAGEPYRNLKAAERLAGTVRRMLLSG